MNNKLTIWSWRGAIQKAELASTTKLVLLNLSIYMNELGNGCFPSTKRQAEDTGLSERSVCTHLEIASEAGFLIKEKHGYAGQQWARSEYKASYPKGTELGANDDKALNLTTQGTEPDDTKALKEVQSNTPYNTPVNTPTIYTDKKPKNTRFKKPTIEEIKEYCISRNNSIDAEYFFDFYEARDWYLKKAKMKNWRACIRTWEHNTFKSKTAKQGTYTNTSTSYGSDIPL